MNRVGKFYGKFFTGIFISVLFLSLSGCGGSQNSEGLTIQILPQQSYLLPGAASSCADVSAFKTALLTGGATGTILEAQSVQKLRVSFPRFSLSWKHASILTVAYIRFKVSSPYLSSGAFIYDITSSELDALLGRLSSTFKGSDDMLNSVDGVNGAVVKGTVYSNDPGRDCKTNSQNALDGSPCTPVPSLFSILYGVCGVNVGGITLSQNAPNSLTMPFTMTLVGYAVDPKTFAQTPVQAIALGSIAYNGIGN